MQVLNYKALFEMGVLEERSPCCKHRNEHFKERRHASDKYLQKANPAETKIESHRAENILKESGGDSLERKSASGEKSPDPSRAPYTPAF